MPACIQFSDENGIVNLTEVDERMCRDFGVAPDPTKYYRYWLETIGFGIALGKTREELIEIFPDYATITEWLFENFKIESWFER